MDDIFNRSPNKRSDVCKDEADVFSYDNILLNRNTVNPTSPAFSSMKSSMKKNRTVSSPSLPSHSPTHTHTPSNTPTNTPIHTNTPSNTPTHTHTHTKTPTNTPTNTLTQSTDIYDASYALFSCPFCSLTDDSITTKSNTINNDVIDDVITNTNTHNTHTVTEETSSISDASLRRVLATRKYRPSDSPFELAREIAKIPRRLLLDDRRAEWTKERRSEDDVFDSDGEFESIVTEELERQEEARLKNGDYFLHDRSTTSDFLRRYKKANGISCDENETEHPSLKLSDILNKPHIDEEYDKDDASEKITKSLNNLNIGSPKYTKSCSYSGQKSPNMMKDTRKSCTSLSKDQFTNRFTNDLSKSTTFITKEQCNSKIQDPIGTKPVNFLSPKSATNVCTRSNLIVSKTPAKSTGCLTSDFGLESFNNGSKFGAIGSRNDQSSLKLAKDVNKTLKDGKQKMDDKEMMRMAEDFALGNDVLRVREDLYRRSGSRMPYARDFRGHWS